MATRDVRLPAGHPTVALGRIGVLLINLGTPEGTSYWPMRRYLKEFLSDRRVIETNRVVWWFILNGLVLTRRPQRSGHAYERIWNRELDESPLKTLTRAQADKVGAAMAWEPRVQVDWAMRYGQPAIGPAVERLKAQGCDRILLAPLYPQYSAATVATALDQAFDVLKTMRWQPAIRTLPPYHDHPAYIDALAQSVRAHLDQIAWQPDVIVASFHGLPEDSLAKGDPYHCHCQKTTRLLRAALDLPDDGLVIAFQSRFGRAEWLKPYTDDKVAELARSGAKNLLVITPGFASDCVETLEEIAIGTRAVFIDSGGENFSLVPCLNDSAPSIAMLSEIIRRELLGWI
jgi:protoporphyrin/coproporphyrin ferrochelatase